MAKERSRRDDKLIESQLNTLSSAISSYSRSKYKLPGDLKDLNLNGDAKQLVDKNLVAYKAESSSTYTVPTNTQPRTGASITQARQTFRYQLCVTYKHESRNYGSYSFSYNYDEYETYPQTYDHPAGEVCYKLETSPY
ncbi:MAG TPA: hypothetical protein VFK03_02545 [Candidatus Saccharimonadales bacterium]|nr:hypothetical protein [Candidatus Saccharimonadales bacterium]